MTKAVESSTSLSSKLSRLAPGLGLLRSYELSWLRPDLVAGLTPEIRKYAPGPVVLASGRPFFASRL